MFVEVFDADKSTKVILNLENVSQIVPISSGGCVISLFGGGSIKVSDKYDQFKQFVITPVSSDDVKRISERIGVTPIKTPAPLSDLPVFSTTPSQTPNPVAQPIVLPDPAKKGPGRPRKVDSEKTEETPQEAQ